MPVVTGPFRIWSYCSAERLRPKLIEARCEFVEDPVDDAPRVREVTSSGLKVMFLPGYAIRAERRDGESEDAARARVYEIVAACEAEQDARAQAEAERSADLRLTDVLNHAIKVLWVVQRPNRPDEEFVTLELRRPSARERRRFEDAAGAVSEFEALDVSVPAEAHVKYRVTARMR